MSLPLITKCRPITFDECIGNKEVIQRLSEAVKSESRPHCYLFTGSSGIGKTTIARIIGHELKATIKDLDAASHNSVDDTRLLGQDAGFKPLTGGNLIIIIDECHALSKQAWSPLLKLIEEPPDYLYIALCTTEKDKVPDTIKTRCYPVTLKNISLGEISGLVEVVAELEGWTVENNVFQSIVNSSEGSARRALSILQAGHACASKDELSKVVEDVDSDDNPAIKLAKYILKGGRNWKAISQHLEQLNGQEEEAIFTMSRYFAGALVRSEEAQAQEIYRILRSFTETDTWDKRIHFYTAIGKVLWGQLPF
jgi:DNA polymerase III gamma/tau subunit